MGCGLDICYPPEHIELMEKIIETGVIISGHPPGTKANPRNLLDDLDGLEKIIIEILLSQGAKISEELSIMVGINNMELIGELAFMELEGKVIIQGSRVNVSK